MAITPTHSSAFIPASHQPNVARGADPRPQPQGELPSKQVQAPAHTDKAENERSQDTDKAKQRAAAQHQAEVQQTKGRQQNTAGDERRQRDERGDGESHAAEGEARPKRAIGNPQQFTEEELRQLQDLSQRDREVRAHEAAHLATAGQYARGGMRFQFETGPDGRRYAVGGEVSIDTSPVPNDPEATLQKARALRAAALAPAEPSSQDRSIAVEAMRMAAEAQAEILSAKVEQAVPDQPHETRGEAAAEPANPAEGDSRAATAPDARDGGSDPAQSAQGSHPARDHYETVATTQPGGDERQVLDVIA